MLHLLAALLVLLPMPSGLLVVPAARPASPLAQAAPAAAGTALYVLYADPPAIAVIEPHSGQLLATVPLPGAPGHLVLSPDGRQAYITLGLGPPAGRGSALVVLDTGTQAITPLVPLEGAARALSTSADGTRVYVATTAERWVNPDGSRNARGSDALTVVELATGRIVATIPLPAIPFSVLADPTAQAVYVGSDRMLFRVDPMGAALEATLALDAPAAGLALSPDATRLYVAGGGTRRDQSLLAVIDTTTFQVVAEVGRQELPADAAASTAITLSPDGTRAYLAVLAGNPHLRSHLAVVDTVNPALVATVLVGGNPLGVAASPDGAQIYVANTGSDSISVVDTATNEVRATLQEQPYAQPRALAVKPGGLLRPSEAAATP